MGDRTAAAEVISIRRWLKRSSTNQKLSLMSHVPEEALEDSRSHHTSQRNFRYGSWRRRGHSGGRER